MNDLRLLARSNPLPEAPEYDDAAEAVLAELLAVTRATPATRRRSRWPAAAGAGALAVVAAAAVVVMLGGDRPERTLPRHDAPLTAELVADRTGRALASAGGYIVRGTQTTTGPNGTYRSVTWSDEGSRRNFRTREYDRQGDLVLDSASYVSPDGPASLQIDYAARRYTLTSGAGGRKPVVKPGQPAGTAAPQPRAGNDATGIARDLAQGTDTLLGRTTLDGRPVLRLANHEPGMHRAIWIDPDTYLPVRMTAHGSWGSYRIDYTWIRRTAGNLKHCFQPAIPAGFTKVDPAAKG